MSPPKVLRYARRFETYHTPRVTPAALSSSHIDRDYYRCWQGLRSHFDPAVKDGGMDGRPADDRPSDEMQTAGSVSSNGVLINGK